MKAVVMKINNNKAVLMQEDGSFVFVPNKNYEVGQEVFWNGSKDTSIFMYAKMAKVAAAVFLIIFLGASALAYVTPQSYVSIDINPSIELEVNMFNRVIDALGVNYDGQTVLEKVEISHKSMERALELIINQVNIEGYLNSNDSKAVVVAVHSLNQEKEIKVMDSAKMQIDESLTELEISATVSVDLVTGQTIESAHDIGTTAGKLELINEYIELSDTDESANNLKDKPVQELIKEIDELRKDQDKAGKESQHDKENNNNSYNKDKDQSEHSSYDSKETEKDKTSYKNNSNDKDDYEEEYFRDR